jgi:hypothetical protein
MFPAIPRRRYPRREGGVAVVTQVTGGHAELRLPPRQQSRRVGEAVHDLPLSAEGIDDDETDVVETRHEGQLGKAIASRCEPFGSQEPLVEIDLHNAVRLHRKGRLESIGGNGSAADAGTVLDTATEERLPGLETERVDPGRSEGHSRGTEEVATDRRLPRLEENLFRQKLGIGAPGEDRPGEVERGKHLDVHAILALIRVEEGSSRGGLLEADIEGYRTAHPGWSDDLTGQNCAAPAPADRPHRLDLRRNGDLDGEKRRIVGDPKARLLEIRRLEPFLILQAAQRLGYCHQPQREQQRVPAESDE